MRRTEYKQFNKCLSFSQEENARLQQEHRERQMEVRHYTAAMT